MRTPSRPTSLLLLMAAALLVGACGGAPTASTAALAAASDGSTGAPVESTAASATTGAEASASGFTFESSEPIAVTDDEADLLAQIPETVCGEPAIRNARSGATLVGTDESAPGRRALAALGKTADDVSFASGVEWEGTCGVGMLRIRGLTADQLQPFIEAVVMAQAESPAAPATIAGRQASRFEDLGGIGYYWIVGDTIVFISATTEAKAAELAGQLP